MICRPGMQYDVVFTVVEFWFKYLGSGRCHKIDEHSQENIHPNIARIYSDLPALYWHCDHVLVALPRFVANLSSELSDTHSQTISQLLRHGYRLQPVYSFGEDETYHFAPGLLDFRLW